MVALPLFGVFPSSSFFVPQPVHVCAGQLPTQPEQALPVKGCCVGFWFLASSGVLSSLVSRLRPASDVRELCDKPYLF